MGTCTVVTILAISDNQYVLNPPPMAGNFGGSNEIYGSSGGMGGMGQNSSYSGSSGYQGNSYGYGGYGYMPHGYSSYGSSSVTFFDFFYFFVWLIFLETFAHVIFIESNPFIFIIFINVSQGPGASESISQLFPSYY